MLYSEIIAVCSQIHTKHVNAVCGQNADFFRAFKGLSEIFGQDLWNKKQQRQPLMSTIRCDVILKALF
jgi:hypothetical protein